MNSVRVRMEGGGKLSNFVRKGFFLLKWANWDLTLGEEGVTKVLNARM